MRAEAASTSAVSRSCGTAEALTKEPISIRRNASGGQLLQQADLRLGRDERADALEAVARPDLDDLDRRSVRRACDIR